MSLDVYLYGEQQPVDCRCQECGHEHTAIRQEYVYSANITHNLNVMAEEAGIYQCLWRPEEVGITHASQLIEPLRKGLAMMKADPLRFQKLNPSNGWGTYQDFIPWIEKYIVACEQYPDATIRVSR